MGKYLITHGPEQIKWVENKLDYRISNKVQVLLFNDLNDVYQTNLGIKEESYKTYNEIARFVYENALSGEIYKVNAIWPLGPRIDDWSADFNYGDRRGLTSTEYTPHPK